jgi:tetratricopeptide (TPR) repeat protein
MRSHWFFVASAAAILLNTFSASAADTTVRAYRGMARAYGLAGNWAQAREIATKALGLDSKSAKTYCCLGWIDVTIDDERAAKSYRRATELSPDLAGAWLGLARASRNLGRTADAQQALAGARKAEPSNAAAHCCTGWVASRGKDWETAEREYRAALAADATLTRAYVRLAFVRVGQKRLDEADELCAKAAASDPQDSEAACCRGRIYRERSDWRAAEHWFRRGIELGQNTSGVHIRLADVLLKQGRRDEALAEAKAGLQVGQKSADVHCCLGTVYTALGRREEAITEFHAALKLDAGLARAREQLEEGKGQPERAQ